jgi:DNA mismatch repair protein MutS
MKIDIATRRNLEITETMRDKNKKGSLLWVLDSTNTAMGARLLHSWLDRPLISVDRIKERLNAVEVLKNNPILRSDIIEKLDKIYDIERLTGRIVYGSANARDLVALKMSLSVLPELKELLIGIDDELIKKLVDGIDLSTDVVDLIEKAIVDEPPITTKEGGLIKTGYNEEVDKLKYISTNAKSIIAEMEAREREKTGIKNLKIAFNKVFGYYIEVTRSYFDLVPKEYIRKQTLVDKERYIIQELKDLEETITGAEEKVISLEYDLFCKVRNYVAAQVERLQKTASMIANIDVLTSLADTAEKNNYVKPVIDDCGIIDIKDGRHPVVEKCIASGEFVPNDTFLDFEDNKINIITGPNMAGKSTYMRQVALITLMAQIGSFVPAKKAQIGICDKIFTRVGASDDLSMRSKYFYGRNDGGCNNS